MISGGSKKWVMLFEISVTVVVACGASSIVLTSLLDNVTTGGLADTVSVLKGKDDRAEQICVFRALRLSPVMGRYCPG